MAIDCNVLKASLEKTASWYENSGVMLPPDGSWGVAERVLLTDNNETKQKTFDAFPAWTHHEHYSIIEQRRADCNMEAAFLFLLMGDALESEKYRKLGESLLHYLYFRSGLLMRHATIPGYQPGVWQWSHIKWQPCVYWDDDAWMCALQLMVARRWPELDARFDMTTWAMKLAHVMADAFLDCFDDEYDLAKTPNWAGNLKLPHWGSLVVLALALAYREEADAKFADAIDRYHRYLQKNADSFTTSEYGYAIMGAVQSMVVRDDALSKEIAERFGAKLLNHMDMKTGNIPAQHYEAPVGEHLADTIYTLNWAILALQELRVYGAQGQYAEAFDKLLALLLKIQDSAPEPWLNGCWRGMYDMKAQSWGGGDCYEGGANSIYTGWTNAPIPWAVVNELLGKTLADY